MAEAIELRVIAEEMGSIMKRYALERTADPYAFYESFEDVRADGALTDEEKEHILKSMDFDTTFQAPDDEPDLTSIDIGLPGSNGIDSSLDRLRERYTKPPAETAKAGSGGLEYVHFGRIVVSLNGESDLDAKVVEVARTLAAPWKSELSFVTVVDTPEVSAELVNFPSHEEALIPRNAVQRTLAFRLSERRSRVLERLKAADVAPPTELDVRHGNADQEILDHAKERNADLIVAGFQKRSWFDRLMTSDPSQRLAVCSDCPVLLVPET